MQESADDIHQYLQCCRSVLQAASPEREQYEQYIHQFVKNPENFEKLKRIFEDQHESHVKLITIESLTKVLAKKYSVGASDSDSRYRGIDDFENKEYCHYKAVMEYFVQYLSVKKLTDAMFVVNSICDFYGSVLKYMVVNSMQLPALEDIERAFFGTNASIEDLTIGLKLVFYSIGNLLVNCHHYGYFKFRKMVYSFQSKYLVEMLNLTRKTIKVIWPNARETGGPFVVLLKQALEILYKCLTYPFNLTYFDFNTDNTGGDITITIFPEEFGITLSDMLMYDCLFGLFYTQEIELKQLSLRILARIASTRLSIFDESAREDYRARFIAGFPVLVQNSPLEDQTFSNDIVEYVLRIIFVFGQNNIRTSLLFPLFRQASETFCDSVLKTCVQLDSPLFARLVDFWNKLENLVSYQEIEGRSQVVATCVTHYCDFHINQSQSLSFYIENVKSAKKFVKHVNNRFETFKDFVKKSPEQATTMMVSLAGNLSGMEDQCRAGQFDPNLFFTRFGHFVLIFSKAFMKTDLSYSNFQSYMDDFDMSHTDVEPLLIQRLSEIASFIFNVLKNGQQLTHGLRFDILVGYEMSMLYFIETFLTTAMDKHKLSEDNMLMSIVDPLYRIVMERIGIQGGFEEFFDLMTNKILSNLDYRIISLSDYSIAVLKTLVERIKKIFKSKSKECQLINTFSAKLQNINFSVLSERNFYKLRSKLMETIAVSYLDDNYDDYITNSHVIFERIITTNTENNSVDLMRVFFDLVGIYRAISLSKIIIVFTKISYPRIQELLQKNAGDKLSDPEFVASLLDFYNVLIENTSQKYSVSQAHTVMYKILTDACQIVSMFLKDINKTLLSLPNKATIVAFLENNLKLVKKLFRIFKSMIKYSDISFSIFHFFGYTVFLEFIQGIHLFMSLTVEHIVDHFPDKAELFLDCFKESCVNLSDFMVEHFTPEEITRILRTLHLFFVKKGDEVIANSETSTLQDETVIQTISTIVGCLCLSLYEAFCINRNDPAFVLKIQQTFENNLSLICDFTLRIVELCSRMNYSVHASNMIADIVFHFLVLFKGDAIMRFLMERLQSDMHVNNGTRKFVRLMYLFEEMQRNVQFKLELVQKEKFHDRFKDFIKGLHGLNGEEFN